MRKYFVSYGDDDVVMTMMMITEMKGMDFKDRIYLKVKVY